MKPTSIIFIIVTIILACAGVLMCISAENMAKDQGIALFKQEHDGNNNYVETYDDIDEASLKKLVISLKNADINVYGGAEKSRIELINFSDNSYNLTASKTQISLSGIDGISGLINLDTFKINFSGFRNYQNYLKYRNRQKTVNLYLSDAAEVIFIDIHTEEGNVTVSDLDIDCDYRLTADKGEVTLSGITTGSTVTLDSKKELTAKISGVTARELILSADASGYVTIENSTFTHKVDATVKSGEFTYYRNEANFAGYNVELNAPAGKISVYGKEYTKKYTEQNVETPLTPVEPETTEADETTPAETGEETKPAATGDLNSISITVKSGDITITDKAPVKPITD